MGWDGLGAVVQDSEAIARHLDLVMALPWIDPETIRARRFKVALDCVHGAGGLIIPALLGRLGCEVVGIGLEPDGRFPREPEPIPENLAELGDLVRAHQADVGLAVDPDVDRLAVVDETGHPIGEDYTLAFAVRAVLARSAHAATARVVVNLSTSQVVEDAARAHGATLVRTPVGEAHVAAGIQAEKALIGGEGNGGVILPELHIGRDAPVGVALVLQYFATVKRPVSALVAEAPRYHIVKAKIARGADLEAAYGRLSGNLSGAAVDRRDGLRLAWEDRWVHVRPSGTEPVIRIIAEAPTRPEAEDLISRCRELL